MEIESKVMLKKVFITKVFLDSVLFANTTFEYGVGGDDKRNIPSWILQEWKAIQTIRKWGYYRVLHENGGKVAKN